MRISRRPIWSEAPTTQPNTVKYRGTKASASIDHERSLRGMEFLTMPHIKSGITINDLIGDFDKYVPGFLIDSWLRVTGKNPLTAARQQKEQQAAYHLWRKRFLAVRIFVFCCAAVLSVWSVLLLPHFSERSPRPETIAIMCLLLIGAFLLYGERSLRAALFASIKENDAAQFINDLDRLVTAIYNHLQATKYTGTKLSGATRVELQACADKILVTRAREVLQIQDAARNVPKEMMNSKEHAIYVFKLHFETLKKFELTDRVYDRYFDIARKELDTEAKARKALDV